MWCLSLILFTYKSHQNQEVPVPKHSMSITIMQPQDFCAAFTLFKDKILGLCLLPFFLVLLMEGISTLYSTLK